MKEFLVGFLAAMGISLSVIGFSGDKPVDTVFVTPEPATFPVNVPSTHPHCGAHPGWIAVQGSVEGLHALAWGCEHPTNGWLVHLDQDGKFNNALNLNTGQRTTDPSQVNDW